MNLRQLFNDLRTPKFVVPAELKRPTFEVNADLERRANAARIAMGDAYLCAVPVKRKIQENEDTWVRIADVPEDSFPIG